MHYKTTLQWGFDIFLQESSSRTVGTKQSLNPIQKLEAVGQILTPQQKEQLGECLQQPMPPQ